MSATAKRQIITAPNASELADMAAQRLIDRIGHSAEPAAICLTGGSTPKHLYELLATPRWRDQIPWPHVHWFIGDDRFVPPGDPLSNIGMACSAFLDNCAAPDTIHPIDTHAANPDEAARGYERALKDFQRLHRTESFLFDLVLMGVGLDGHTASLFPGDPALDEQTHWVVGVEHANVAPFVPRVSLTFRCLAQTHEMLFLSTGADKREILSRVFSGEDLPAGRAHADNGNTVWLLDQAAAPNV
jgi:6-phosphogluconolactonase